MGIRKDCDIKPFIGYVVLKDPLPFIQVLHYEDAMQSVQETDKYSQKFTVLFPVLNEFVEEWHISGVPDNVKMDTFPGKPKAAANKLFLWLVEQCADVYGDKSELIDPNELGAEPTVS